MKLGIITFFIHRISLLVTCFSFILILILNTYVLGASASSDSETESRLEQKTSRALSDDEAPLRFDQADNVELHGTNEHIVNNENENKEKCRSSNIVSQTIASLLQSHFHDKDARSVQRAEIEGFRARGRAMEAQAARKGQTLQDQMHALEKNYKESCRHRGIAESDIEKFHAMYATFTEADWATFFSPNTNLKD